MTTPSELRANTGLAVFVVIMAATLSGVVHGLSYYAVFGVNYFEFGSRDDFIVTALRSPGSFILVMLTWVLIYPRGLSPTFSKVRALSYYFVLQVFLVAMLGTGQAHLVRSGYGKMIGQPACKLTIAYTDNEKEDVFGATPLGSSGQFAIFWFYQLNEVRIISNQAARSVVCNVNP